MKVTEHIHALKIPFKLRVTYELKIIVFYIFTEGNPI